MTSSSSNPVFEAKEEFQQEDREPKQCPPGWYFWDETWAFAYGPFDDEEQARKSCTEYARNL